ncbi:flagella basal body P-ring formation protein FlgA [Rhizobium sp. BK251]|nr:flagella basal body P-ring formation protein FlgA [Rhizobium sp. BK251]
MTFRRKMSAAALRLAGALLGACLLGPAAAYADMGYAVVPTVIIYPGEEVTSANTHEVEVTNPNLAGNYAKSTSEVEGLVSTRTLLPGRTISVSALRAPYAVKRGSNVRLVFAIGNLSISAAGTPLEDASIGDVIRARNMDSGVVVSGTVLADGTIHVVAK